MKLRSILIKNFRQFYGEQELRFPDGIDGRNITVIHGYNGSGKTALLNAFIWCLYGETTKDLEEPDKLENERAVAETPVGGKVEVSVNLEFSIHDITYIVRRLRVSQKSGEAQLRSGEPELMVWKRTRSGTLEEESRRPEALKLLIGQILPQRIYPFFFFNGEQVERLVGASAYADVEDAVKTLLDVEMFGRGMYHLRSVVAPELAQELKAVGDAELQTALDEELKLQQQLEAYQGKLGTIGANIKALSDEIDVYERKQESIKAITALTEKRTALRKELTALETDEAAINDSLRRWLSTDGYLAFADPVFKTTEEIVLGARKRGEIPAKIKPQFVDDLLTRGTCICGRELKQDSAEWRELIHWRASTGLADLEESISKTGAVIPSLRQRCAHFFDDVERLQQRRSIVVAQKRVVREEHDAVEQQLRDKSLGEDAASLAAAIARLTQDRNHAQVQYLLTQKDIDEWQDKLSTLKSNIRDLKTKDDRAGIIKRQREAVDRVADALERIFQVQKQAVRASLDQRVSEIWKDAAIKDYRASVTDDFRLVLTKRVGATEQQVYGPSTGERQVLALTFVASIVQLAAENAGQDSKHKGLGVTLGGHYPLVMDSPFGALEDDYRAKVAEWVPRLAHQVVLLVSKTQWRNEVENAVRGRVGKEYILELHTSKQEANRTIEVAGQAHPYVVSTHEPFEYTRIQEVE